ncbi:hypothetical protein PoB_005078700 [Plakobranchus ocellatus]|uniref:Uncharacterized protein n=1 Tax=Plakobranchus ocellatus TaxID=259542 RepID=A0AAV4BY91_9GAST|nr:hypothetical protein PoB_005078700 [Plakobranchus ocellatus]
MFPWDDRGDGHPSDTTLLNTLAPVLVAHGLLTHGGAVQPLVISGRPAMTAAEESMDAEEATVVWHRLLVDFLVKHISVNATN